MPAPAKRILATHVKSQKKVIYKSIKSALEINSNMARPWSRQGIWYAMRHNNPYLGWRFEFIDKEAVIPDAKIAVDYGEVRRAIPAYISLLTQINSAE